MKIVLLGHRDIASNIALSLLVTAMPQHRYVVMLSGQVGSDTAAPAALVELARLEQKLCDDLADDRGNDCGVLSFEALAGMTGTEIGVLAQPNSLEGLGLLAGLRPDLVISVRYRRILREAAIAIPKHGVLNLHSGLLPEYKGMMATFWSLLNSEKAIGSTLHYIVDGTIDTGPIVGRVRMPAARKRSYLANVLSLYPGGCTMVVDAVGRIERGETVARQTQMEAGWYYSMPGRDDIQRFEEAGLSLFEGDELQQFLREIDASSATRPVRPFE
jgi:methionyl-tRNA formyltransferase